MRRREVLPLAGLVGAYLLFAALTLVDYPPVFSDEPWLLSTPVSLLRDGENALPMFGEDYNPSIYFSAYLVPFLAVLGVSVEAARVASVLHGAVALVLTWMLARRLGAGRHAVIAPLLLVAIYPFVEVTRYVRPESFELLYALLGLILYLDGRERGGWRLFGAGVSAGIAFGLFFQGAWVVVILAVWALVDLRARPRLLGTLAAGFALAVTPLAVFIGTSLDEYGRYMRKFGNSSIFAQRYADKGPLRSLVDLVSSELQRYDRYLAAVDSRWYVAALAAVVVVAFTALRLRGAWLRVLPLLAVPPLLLACLGANKTPAYLLIAAPGVAVAAALALSRVPLAYALVPAVLVLATYIGVVHAHDPRTATSYADLRDAYGGLHYPAGSLVIGLPTHYAFVLDRDVDFRSVHYFTDFDTFELDTAAEARAKLGRDAARRRVYLFRSDGLLSTLASFSPDGVISEELNSLLAERFRPVSVLRFTDTPYGDYTDTLTVFG